VARRQRPADPQLIPPRADAFAPARPHPRKTPYQERRPVLATRRRSIPGDNIMGKYLVGWLLGVPVFVLVILYFFFH
jgi:hypothetical protein